MDQIDQKVIWVCYHLVESTVGENGSFGPERYTWFFFFFFGYYQRKIDDYVGESFLADIYD